MDDVIGKAMFNSLKEINYRSANEQWSEEKEKAYKECVMLVLGNLGYTPTELFNWILENIVFLVQENA